MVKNVLMLSVGIVIWWLTGYAFSFISVDVFIGEDGYAGDEWGSSLHFAQATVFGFIGIYVLFIINGAVMERVQFFVYMLTALFLMGFVWPAVVAWVWGTGWLMEDVLERGFIDPGGAAVIHLFAGAFALPGLLLSRRNYKNGEDRRPLDDKPASTALVTIGVFFEMIGIVYINAVHAQSVTEASLAFFNTWLSGGMSAVVGLILGPLCSQKCEDYYLCSLKGFIAGMVGVAGFAQNCMGWEALVHGVISGVLFSLFAILSRRIDDRAYVIPAHLIAGFGGVFGTAFWDYSNGIYHQGHGKQIGFQLVGIGCIAFWACVWGFLIYGLSMACRCLALSDELKEDGLEMVELDLGLEGFRSSGRKAQDSA